MKILAAFLFIFASCFVSTTSGQCDNRPCGPDSLKGPLRLLIPQGHAGADFRPACRFHDACYGNKGVDREQCDREWYRRMLAACCCSRRPAACRRRARIMYEVVRKHGQEAFDKAQQTAEAK